MLNINLFNTTMSEVANRFAEDLFPTPPVISLCVMMMYPNETVDKTKLLADLDRFCPPDGFEQLSDKFPNCVFYKGNIDGNRFSIKVFSDASMHVTGIRTDAHLTEISNLFFSHVGEIAGVDLTLARVKLQLLSSTFKIAKDVHIDRLGELIVNEPGVEVHRDNQRHRGLKVSFLQDQAVDGKVKRKNLKVTALVFRTGSVILTGATRLDSLLEAYWLLMEMLQKHKAEVCTERVAKKPVTGKRAREDWDSVFGDIAARLNA